MPKTRPDFPVDLFQDSVVEHVEQSASAPLTFYIASAAEMITPWGQNVMRRDKELREFWPSENTLAGAIFAVSGRNAAYKWEIKGEAPKTRSAVEWMLHNALANTTRGWNQFMLKFSEDYYTNVNQNKNVNVNQNKNVNVNSHRDVDVDVDVDVDHHHGGYYGGWCYHDPNPWATAAAVMVTAAVIGSIVNTLPSGCQTVIINGFAYQQCGSTWYQPQISGSSTTYIVVNPPR